MNKTEKRREITASVAEKDNLTTREKCVVWAMCRNDLCVNRTADALFYSRGSIEYRARRIKEKTGYDPRTFYGAKRLLEKIGEDPGIGGVEYGDD